MVEATPAAPFRGYASDLLKVEKHMRLRRARIAAILQADEIAPTVVSFPMMGVGNFTEPSYPNNGPLSRSKYIPDELINPHPRFGTLTANIRHRRGTNVEIRIPKAVSPPAGSPDHVDMDAMAFGMGNCCLQVTFQARDVHESRHLYDHLAVLAPIMLALSAATPILRGHLVDVDVRWSTIAASVDDRTPAERGGEGSGEEDVPDPDPSMVSGGMRQITKSRYDSISSYICNHHGGEDPHTNTQQYNDLTLEYDEEVHSKLVANGFDEVISRHIAHLWIRDPLVIFSERIHLNDTAHTDHFENIQSTNWQTVRWKPPPGGMDPHQDPAKRIGWRTEFRSMEVQLTDFENAAFTTFVVLVSRVILTFDLNLYIPLSKVDENMTRAHSQNAATQQRFWWRMHMGPPQQSDCTSKTGCCRVHEDQDGCEEMTILEILEGKGNYYPGMIVLVNAYLDKINADPETTKQMNLYMELLRRRASGKLVTCAQWMRNFVTKHRSYKGDGVVSQEIAYDLMTTCNKVGQGKVQVPEMFGDMLISPMDNKDAYPVPLNQEHDVESLDRVIGRYLKRASKKRKMEAMIDAKEKEIYERHRELEQLKDQLNHIDQLPDTPGDSPMVGSTGACQPPKFSIQQAQTVVWKR